VCYDVDMAKVRKKHVQRSFKFRTWGGKRAGAGRKQVNERKSQPHRTRPPVRPNEAVHVSMRVAPELSRLRRRDGYHAVRKAMQVVLPRTDFRIVHASIQANHVHLLAEAESKDALARGVQAFQISAARKLNQAESARRGRVRRGPVFPDRYHAEVISTPRQARHALAYVMNNWRRHKEDRAPHARQWILDPYSSAISFKGWTERSWDPPASYDPLPVCAPQTWLLREGWKRAGPIGVFTVPGPRR
jgi:REP element-mobilizing transposase RayT